MSRKVLSKDEREAVDQRRLAALKELASMSPEYTDYLNKISDVKRKRLLDEQKRMRNGLQAIAPLTCFGPAKCPFINNCPVATRTEDGQIDMEDLSDYPMYQPCVYEKLYMQQKVIDYVTYLEVDPSNPIEMAIVNDLAVIDLYKNRAMLVMGSGDRQGDGRDFLKQDRKLSQGEHGTMEEITTQLHPAAGYLDTLEKRRIKLTESLVETRRSRIDVALKQGTPNVTSQLVDELAAIKKALEDSGAKKIAPDRLFEEKRIKIEDE